MIFFLQIVMSIVVLALELHLQPWAHLVEGIRRIDFWPFVATLVLALCSIAATGLRWIYIVRRLAPVAVVEHWRIYCLGTFFNSFTPANIGGDVYRVVALRPGTTDQTVTSLLGAVMVERILGLGSFFLGYLLSLAIYAVIHPHLAARLPDLLLYSAVPVAVVLVVMVLLPWLYRARRFLPVRFHSARLASQLRNFEQGIRLATTSNLGTLGVLTILAWAVWVATVSVVAARLGLGVPLPLLAMIVSFTEIVRLIPVSFQGIGIREGVFSALVGLVGGAPATGFVVAAVAYAGLSLALAISGVIGGLLSVASSRRRTLNAKIARFKIPDKC